MPNDYFQFKQFLIKQDRCAMKVGTDGVLLGAWTNCEQLNKILDIGTGTGLIALMLAQRSEAEIDAIEIDESAYKQATENIKESKWNNRISVYHSSFQHYLKTCQPKYDLIVSNPPYFSNSLKAKDKSRTLARHNQTLPFTELISGAYTLLLPNGKLALIIPAEIFPYIKNESENTGFYCNIIMNIYPNFSKKLKRIMVEFSKQKTNMTEENLIIEKATRHEYTNEYITLTKDFYLAF